MRLTINGEPHDVPDGISLSELLIHLALTDGPVAIECNREVIPRAQHSQFKPKAGDALEIVHFVGGG